MVTRDLVVMGARERRPGVPEPLGVTQVNANALVVSHYQFNWPQLQVRYYFGLIGNSILLYNDKTCTFDVLCPRFGKRAIKVM